MTEVLRLVSHPVAARVSVALLHFLWQGTLLAGLGLLMLAALRRSSASTRYAVLLAVFAAMALCPVLTLAIGGGTSLPVAPQPAYAAAGAPGGQAIATTVSPPNGTPRVEGSMTPATAVSREHTVASANPQWSRWARWLPPVLPWVSVLWLAGVAVLSLRLLVRWWAVWRLAKGLRPAERHWQEALGVLCRRLSVSRPIRLMVSTAARVPMVIGWLRPAIVIPASAFTGLTPEQLKALLAHELAHIRRHDQWVSLAQTLVELLLFYHPAIWWISGAIRVEREHCCDDAAVAQSGDVAGYMRALTWVEEHRGARLTSAVAATGSPLVQRVRRLAGYPAPAEMRLAWLAAVTALVVATLIPLAGTISGAADEEGHQLGVREQWQPETENDPRLQQPVNIEIIGRAAVPALEMLSEETGVSLTVPPENVDTVGERKLTVIAQGCSLKAIMVQLPRALRECHWDIDPSGPEPVYLLHRNGGAETTMARLAEEEPLRERLRREAEGRAARRSRVETAWEALAMSPKELAELEKTDLYLARSVMDTESRSMLELFLSLPEEKMDQFIDTGTTAMPYPDAPEHFRKAADGLLQTSREEWVAERGSDDPALRIWDVVQSNLDEATIQYEDLGDGGSYLRIFAFDEDGTRCSWGVEPVMWPQYPRLGPPEHWYRPLLLGTGTADEKAADALAHEWQARGAAEKHAQTEEKRRREWREPHTPALHGAVTLPFSPGERVDPVEVQRLVARETGLSLVSDYFMPWLFPPPVPEEACVSMPAWRLLYVLGDHWFWNYDWNEAGDCLVFHDRHWYRKPPEAPEALVEAYRERLSQQGGFTLNDVAGAAVVLSTRPLPRPSHPVWGVAWPYDLARRGMCAKPSAALLLYASLSPVQKTTARSAAGLPYADMTRAQQELVSGAAVESEERWRHPDRPKPPLSHEEITSAVYHINESTRDLPGQSGDLLDAGPAAVFELVIEFPSRQVRHTQILPLARASSQAGSRTSR